MTEAIDVPKVVVRDAPHETSTKNSIDGVEIKGNDEQVPFAIAGYAVFDGNGKAKGVDSSNFNGEVTRKEPDSPTYTVKADYIAPSNGNYSSSSNTATIVISQVGLTVKANNVQRQSS